MSMLEALDAKNRAKIDKWIYVSPKYKHRLYEDEEEEGNGGQDGGPKAGGRIDMAEIDRRKLAVGWFFTPTEKVKAPEEVNAEEEEALFEVTSLSKKGGKPPKVL